MDSQASTCFNCLRKLVDCFRTVCVAQRTEFEYDSSKVDAFIRCVYIKIVVFVDHTIGTICPCCDR
jgi:hypothetical protein